MARKFGITFGEPRGSGTLSFSRDGGVQGQRIFMVAWSDSEDFLRGLKGYSQTVGVVTHRQKPDKFPATRWNLYCTSAAREGVGRSRRHAVHVPSKP